MTHIDRFQARREELFQNIQNPILLMGNGNRARNLPMNTLPFRQDSSFLYYTGCTEPNSALLITQSEHRLFLEPPHKDDALWHGHVETINQRSTKLGFNSVSPMGDLLSKLSSMGTVQTIAVPDETINQWLSQHLGVTLQFGQDHGNPDLVQSIIQQRRILDEDELQSMRNAQLITAKAHICAMKATHVGHNERDVVAAFLSPIWKAGLTTAYDPIVTVDGHILHNFHYHNTLQKGQLLLLDGGAESAHGYATDVTRTWPVNGVWAPQQKEAYDAVLRAQTAAIRMLKVGQRYRDIHTKAALVLSEFLVEAGLLKISAEHAVEIGAHALFFPHGLGHLLGLDVHDLENFGDQAAYSKGRKRSEQFGTSFLRMDLDLEENMVVTIEPGFYIVPAILEDPKLRERFNGAIHWEKLSQWDGFGGIRIEDDVRVTANKPEILSLGTPKQIDEIARYLSL